MILSSCEISFGTYSLKETEAYASVDELFAMPLWFVMVGHNGMCKSAFVSNIRQVYSFRLKYFLAISWTFITFWRVAENGENIMEQMMAPIIQGDIFWVLVHAR